MSQYVAPPVDFCAARKSFATHSRISESATEQARRGVCCWAWEGEETQRSEHRSGALCLSPGNVEQVLNQLELAFSAARFVCVKPDEIRSEFNQALTELDMRSTPGLGYFHSLGSDNRECLCKEDGLTLDPVRVETLYRLVSERISLLSTDGAYADPIRIFVKQEALKRSKYEEKRWRIISAVSLEDTMVDRILFRRFQKAFIDAASKIPSMVGLNPLMGGYRLMASIFGEGPFVCEDKSSWDWTVTEPLLKLGLNLIQRLAVDADDWWMTATAKRWELLYRTAEFKFHATSETCRQPYWGVVKSGCYLTITLNTMLQAVLHGLVNQSLGWHLQVSLPWCLGDDTIRKEHPEEEDYLRSISLLGVKIKTERRLRAEFAGFEFDEHSVLPVYRSKHAFKLIHCPESTLTETIRMYQLMYAFDEKMFRWIQSVGIARGCLEGLTSHRLALAIIRGSVPIGSMLEG